MKNEIGWVRAAPINILSQYTHKKTRTAEWDLRVIKSRRRANRIRGPRPMLALGGPSWRRSSSRRRHGHRAWWSRGASSCRGRGRLSRYSGRGSLSKTTSKVMSISICSSSIASSLMLRHPCRNMSSIRGWGRGLRRSRFIRGGRVRSVCCRIMRCSFRLKGSSSKCFLITMDNLSSSWAGRCLNRMDQICHWVSRKGWGIELDITTRTWTTCSWITPTRRAVISSLPRIATFEILLLLKRRRGRCATGISSSSLIQRGFRSMSAIWNAGSTWRMRGRGRLIKSIWCVKSIKLEMQIKVELLSISSTSSTTGPMREAISSREMRPRLCASRLEVRILTRSQTLAIICWTVGSAGKSKCPCTMNTIHRGKLARLSAGLGLRYSARVWLAGQFAAWTKLSGRGSPRYRGISSSRWETGTTTISMEFIRACSALLKGNKPATSTWAP